MHTYRSHPSPFSLQNGLIAFNAPCTIQHCSDLFSYIHRLYGTCAHSRYEEIALHFYFLDTGFVVSFRPSHQEYIKANAGIETSNAELSQATICKAALGQLKLHNATEYRKYMHFVSMKKMTKKKRIKHANKHFMLLCIPYQTRYVKNFCTHSTL